MQCFKDVMVTWPTAVCEVLSLSSKHCYFCYYFFPVRKYQIDMSQFLAVYIKGYGSAPICESITALLK